VTGLIIYQAVGIESKELSHYSDLDSKAIKKGSLSLIKK